MSDPSHFEKGEKVFRRHTPGRQGYITGRPPLSRANDLYYPVDFQDGAIEYVPNYELERVNTDSLDIVWLIDQCHFGNASDLRRNLSHIQISGKLSSLIYSLDITNTEFYPYQFKPVLSFLESPSRGLLIADEVGLGKTIEAGLIWTELRARYDYRRVLVVCPAILREKWRDELRDRFGVDATIMDATELLTELKRPPNRIPDGKGIICSIQGIRRNQNQSGPRSKLAQFLDEQSDLPPIIDLVIIDEAHYLRNPGSQSARLGKMLRDVSENVLLLSATPINLRSDDLFTLLNIVDPDTFDVPEFFPQILQINEPLVKARHLILNTDVAAKNIRECLTKAAATGHGFLDNSSLIHHIINILQDPESVATNASRVRIADMIDRVNILRHVINRTRKSEVLEFGVVRRPYSKFVELDENGIERKFYDDVTNAIRHYAEERGINDGFLLANPQRQVASCMYAAAKSWSDRTANANEHFYQDIIYEDIGVEIDNATDVSPLIDYLTSKALSLVDLQQLRMHDSKFDAFFDVIEKHLTKNPQEKIVVFSYFRATLSYLQERLVEKGIASQVLMGGMRESKQDAIHRFRTDHSTKVLLSSEVASEGVDLQFCRVIVNYDLPWNPMKVEQRIGRLDRIGQQAKSILIWNFGYADTIDQRIYERLFERLEIFKRALGGMEAILGEKIKELTDYLISHQLTPTEEERRISQTAIAIENIRQEEERLERDASNLIAHSEYILKKVKTAYKLKKRITEDDLIIYVKDYLKKHSPGHEFRQMESGKQRFKIRLPAKTAAELSEYIETKSLHGQTNLIKGGTVRCEFLNSVTTTTGSVEQINQFHPLVRFISTKVNDDDFFPVVAVKLPAQESDTGSSLPAGQYAFALNKWAFTGLREEEDIRIRVVHVEQDFTLDAEDSWELLNTVRFGGSDWPESSTQVSPPHLTTKIFECYDYLNREFDDESNVRKAENKDRINLQIRSAKQHRDRQVQSLEQVLNNYRSRNETRMIPATQGRIEKIKDKFEVKIKKLEKRKNMESSTQQVCCGVLLIE